MAQFYAHIQGSRGPASRLGCKRSGIRTSTKSWDGEVNVTMWTTMAGDFVRITVGKHGEIGATVIYQGAVLTAERTIRGMVAAYQELGPLGRMAIEEEYNRRRLSTVD